MRVACLVPAYREEGRVGETVRALLALDRVDRVVVVDDGSPGGTAAEAEAAGAEVLRLHRTLGKGHALAAGLDQALADADVVAFADADLRDSAAQLDLLLEPVVSGAADMTIALFPPPPGKAGFGLVKGLARRAIARLGGGFEADAPLSGQRALNSAAIDAVRPLGGGFGAEVTMSVRALRAGLRVLEVPTTMTHAHTGRDLAGFLHRGRQFADVLVAVARLRLEHRDRPGRGERT